MYENKPRIHWLLWPFYAEIIISLNPLDGQKKSANQIKCAALQNIEVRYPTESKDIKFRLRFWLNRFVNIMFCAPFQSGSCGVYRPTIKLTNTWSDVSCCFIGWFLCFNVIQNINTFSAKFQNYTQKYARKNGYVTPSFIAHSMDFCTIFFFLFGE